MRPAVEAGEKLGFLPGDLTQKVDPYLRPLYDALYEMLGIEKVAKLIERNVIEIAPLAYMRGRTLNDSFVILDEAQNTTIEQMKMFLTRIGFGSRRGRHRRRDPDRPAAPREIRPARRDRGAARRRRRQLHVLHRAATSCATRWCSASCARTRSATSGTDDAAVAMSAPLATQRLRRTAARGRNGVPIARSFEHWVRAALAARRGARPKSPSAGRHRARPRRSTAAIAARTTRPTC